MSIERINRQPYINAYSSNSSKTVEKVNKAKETDRIEISELAKSLKDYSLTSDIGNVKKVADIKARLESGTYSVDVRSTAKSILDGIKGSNA